MNERIQALIKQCETLDGDEDGYFTRFDKERFAKLIWEEAYQQGLSDGAEQAILRERG